MANQFNSIETGDGRFPDTVWSDVSHARGSDDIRAFQALSNLCNAYWPPLYVFLRKTGENSPKAKDIVQDFFRALIEKEYLKTADREKGKLRTFLICALKRHRGKMNTDVIDDSGNCVPIDVGRADDYYPKEIADSSMTPSQAYDFAFAVRFHERVMEKLRRWYEDRDKLMEFDLLKESLPKNSRETPYRKIADLLGTTENNVKQLVRRLRKRHREFREDEIRQTTSATSRKEIDEEIRNLKDALR